MKKILFAFVALVMSVSAANAVVDTYTIKRENLPQEAREMLDEHFPKAKVSYIKVDRHLLKKTDYDVKLTNGATVEFSNKGKWTSVDCGKKGVPEALVPQAVRKHVAKNHPKATIVSIAKRDAGYDVGLSDGLELRFNLLGQFKSVSTPK